MKPILLPLFGAILAWPSLAATPFDGRWDITVTPHPDAQAASKNPQANSPYPDWMEVVEKDGTTSIRIQPRSGGAREIKDFKLTGSHLSLNLAGANAKAPAFTWELDVIGDKLAGIQKRAEAAVGEIAGVRA